MFGEMGDLICLMMYGYVGFDGRCGIGAFLRLVIVLAMM
jgi:hypothetical protein